MKKLLTLALSLIMCVCCFGLIACNESNDGVEGTYKLYSMTYNDVTIGLGEPMPWGDDTLTEDSIVIELKEDNTVSIAMLEDGETETMTGTWAQAENVITFTTTVMELTATVDGDTLVFSNPGGGAYTLKKV